MAKLSYKPLGIILGVFAGRLADKLFEQFWELAAGESASPSAMDRDRGWAEIIAAAAIRGAVFSGVRAVVDRARCNRLRTRDRVVARQDLDKECLGATVRDRRWAKIVAAAMRVAASAGPAPGSREKKPDENAPRAFWMSL